MQSYLLNTIPILETDLEKGFSFNIPYGYERDAELLEMCGASSIKEFFIEAFFGIRYETLAFQLHFYRKISHIPQHL